MKNGVLKEKNEFLKMKKELEEGVVSAKSEDKVENEDVENHSDDKE